MGTDFDIRVCGEQGRDHGKFMMNYLLIPDAKKYVIAKNVGGT